MYSSLSYFMNDGFFLQEYVYRTSTNASCLSITDENFFVELFRLATDHCKKYSPFYAYGLFGEDGTIEQMFKIEHQLFSDCILYSLFNAKRFALESGSITLPAYYTNDAINFSPKNADCLINGLFSFLKKENITFKGAIDPMVWQQKRARILKYTAPRYSLYKRIFADKIRYNENSQPPKIAFNAYDADFYTYLAYDGDINALIQMLDVRLSKIKSKETLSTDLCHKLNQKISDSFSNSFLINYMSSFSSYNIINMEKAKVDINQTDKLMLSYQFDNFFHTSLYSYWLSTKTKEKFEQCASDYNFNNVKDPYEQFVRSSLNIYGLTNDMLIISLLDYCIERLGRFSTFKPRGTFIDTLIHPENIATMVYRKNDNADNIFHEWLQRIQKLIRLLSNLYIPLLRENFFLMLIEKYKDPNGNIQWKDLLLNLGEYASEHSSSLHTCSYDLTPILPIHCLSPFPADYHTFIKPPEKNAQLQLIDDRDLVTDILKILYLNRSPFCNTKSPLKAISDELTYSSLESSESTSYVNALLDKYTGGILEFIMSYRKD